MLQLANLSSVVLEHESHKINMEHLALTRIAAVFQLVLAMASEYLHLIH